MSVSDTIDAFESHLITEAEAVEQVLCASIDEVYEKAAAAYESHGKPTARREFRRQS